MAGVENRVLSEGAATGQSPLMQRTLSCSANFLPLRPDVSQIDTR